MSITATRKVSSSAPSKYKTTPTSASAGGGESFVEMIDTNNNIVLNDDLKDQHHNNDGGQSKDNDDENENQIKPTTTPYISNTIEVLEASGIFEETNSDYNQKNTNSKNINVYDNNQSIVKEDTSSNKSDEYLKYFYEKNEHLEELDKLI